MMPARKIITNIEIKCKKCGHSEWVLVNVLRGVWTYRCPYCEIEKRFKGELRECLGARTRSALS